MWAELADSAALFSDCWNAPIDRIAGGDEQANASAGRDRREGLWAKVHALHPPRIAHGCARRHTWELRVQLPNSGAGLPWSRWRLEQAAIMYAIRGVACSSPLARSIRWSAASACGAGVSGLTPAGIQAWGAIPTRGRRNHMGNGASRRPWSRRGLMPAGSDAFSRMRSIEFSRHAPRTRMVMVVELTSQQEHFGDELSCV